MDYTFTPMVKTIWIAEDDPDDIIIFKDALEQIHPSANLHTFNDGNPLLKALSTLRAPDFIFGYQHALQWQ